jgi:hypothetical protein
MGETTSRAEVCETGGMESSATARLDEKVQIPYIAKRARASAGRHILAKRTGAIMARPLSHRGRGPGKGRAKQNVGRPADAVFPHVPHTWVVV